MMTSDQTNEQIDDDPFLLLSQAKVWLRSELERYAQNPRSCCGMLAGRGPSSAYSPFESSDGQIPDESYFEAFEEFYRRFLGSADDGDDDKSTPSVLLVATNVAENWTPPEAVNGKGRFLFFPWMKDTVESALLATSRL